MALFLIIVVFLQSVFIGIFANWYYNMLLRLHSHSTGFSKWSIVTVLWFLAIAVIFAVPALAAWLSHIYFSYEKEALLVYAGGWLMGMIGWCLSYLKSRTQLGKTNFFKR